MCSQCCICPIRLIFALLGHFGIKVNCVFVGTDTAKISSLHRKQVLLIAMFILSAALVITMKVIYFFKSQNFWNVVLLQEGQMVLD